MALDEASFGATHQYEPRAARKGKLGFLTYPFRFFFRMVKRMLAGMVRTLAFHPVASLLVVILLALVGFLGYEDYGKGALNLGPSQRISKSSTLPPSPATEAFIKGQTTFNAQLMWQSFSDDLKQQLSQRGTNQQALQRQLDQRKRAGSKVDQVQYVGGVQNPDGTRLFMYSLIIQAPNQQGIAENHYVLTVDQNDKIIKVE
jgi:hypothetical protein